MLGKHAALEEMINRGGFNLSTQEIAERTENHELANVFSDLLTVGLPAKNTSGISLKRKYELLLQRAGEAEENLNSKTRDGRDP